MRISNDLMFVPPPMEVSNGILTIRVANGMAKYRLGTCYGPEDGNVTVGTLISSEWNTPRFVDLLAPNEGDPRNEGG